MSRISTTLLIVVVLMNGTVTVMAASGLSEDLGVQLAPGVSDKVNEVVDELKDGFNPNVNIIESFISLATAALRVFEVVIEGMFAAPTMATNLLGEGPFVEQFVTVMFAPAYIISTLELISIATGNRTV